MSHLSKEVPTRADSPADWGRESDLLRYFAGDGPTTSSDSGPIWPDLSAQKRVQAARDAGITPRLFPSRLTTLPHLHDVPRNHWSYDGDQWVKTTTGEVRDEPPRYNRSAAVCDPRPQRGDALACLPSIVSESDPVEDRTLEEIDSPRLVAQKAAPSTTPEKQGKVEITRGAGVVKVTRPHEQHARQPPTRESGDITGLSESAARRLQVKLAKVRSDHQPVFSTLTYPDAYAWTGKQIKEQIKKFWQRLEYRDASISMVWKIEIKRRKSGTHGAGWKDQNGEIVGMQMPHIHVLIFKDEPGEWEEGEYERVKRMIEKQWHAIVWADADEDHLQSVSDDVRNEDHDVKGEHADAGTRTERIRSRRGTLAYVSEYISKSEQELEHSIGRYWGIYGRETMPWGATVTVALGHTEACRMLRAICKAEGIDPQGLPLTRTHLCNSTRPWDVWCRQAIKHAQPPDDRKSAWLDYIATVEKHDSESMETGGSTFSEWEKEHAPGV